VTLINFVPPVLRTVGPKRVPGLFGQVLIRGVLIQELSESTKGGECGCRLANLRSHHVSTHMWWHPLT